jgi:hypothetical protein
MFGPGKLVMRSMGRRFEGRYGAFGTPKISALLACVGLALIFGAAALSAASALSFAAAKSYSSGRSPHSVAIGDLDGDGKPDLVIANADADTVSVLLNRGDGSFQAKRDYRTDSRPESAVIGDLNGDGKPDLATANEGTVSVLLNRGDGSFQAKRDYATGDLALIHISEHTIR